MPDHSMPANEAPAPPENGLTPPPRLAALRERALLDVGTNPLFREIAALAAQVCGTPTAFIALADDERHHIVASHGETGARELPGDEGLCCRVVDTGDYLEVADAAWDVRFRHDALVDRPGGVRFYAGIPLVDATGFVFGSLCVLDRRPGALDPNQRLALERLAHVIVTLCEARRRERDGAWFGEVVERSLNEILVFDAGTHRVIHANEGARRNLGYTMEELRALTGIDLGVGWSEARRRAMQEALLTGEREQVVFEIEVRRRDGSTYPVEARVQLTEAFGRRAFMLTAIDITARRAAEEALFREKELAQVTLESIGDAMITTDAQGRVTYLNPVAQSLTGWSSAEARGQGAEKVFRIVHEGDDGEAESPIDRVLREGTLTGLASDVALIARDGRRIAVEDSAAPIRARDGSLVGAVLVFRDVSHARSLARHLTWQASHDALTELVNRREFERVARRLFESARTQSLSHSVIYIDLDQFKVVNDTCGHLAGDALLKQLAGLLPSVLRRSDTLARLGGDEFGVLLEACDLPQAARIAEQLLATIRAFRFQWCGRLFSVSASIGIAPMNAASPDLEGVLSAADTACFLAKDKGRNQVQVFHLEDEEVSSRHGELGWAGRLAQCIEEERFFLLGQRVQPVRAAPDAPPEYVELLLRMRGEDGAVIPPMAFIPAAERYGLMAGIDRWVIRRTLACLARHRAERREGEPRLAINLSGVSLSDPGLLDFVLAELERTGARASDLVFEVTETAAVANLSRAARLIHRLRDEGARFALDDFGSGLSSFSYLRNLPVDYLKIDGSFVRTIAEDGVNLAMVDAIRRVGEVMGIRTIAESVESATVLERVRAIGIDFAQGHHIHSPESYLTLRAALAGGTIAEAA
jgi:diguanylate cyclase (GGDEF)-like protein/PAS domain S-box-containing protein